jgi:pimeloyl-ACP methyl ester carboxylesterase/predicted glycosyltransferase
VRARSPDREGVTGDNGVAIHWEVHGTGEPTVLLLPTSPIWHSRQWKGQVHFLARHFRVVTYDGRGNGRSARPEEVGAYRDDALVADARAVLDATDTDAAIVVALCGGTSIAVQFAARHPDRMLGLIAFEPGVQLIAPGHEHWNEPAACWDAPVRDPREWAMFNRQFWQTRWPDWCDFFFGQLLPEPHSTKHHEDAVEWALGTTGEIMAMDVEARLVELPYTETEIIGMCRGITCPVLVVHGDADRCQPVARGRALAELTGGELVVMEGVGHAPPAREPVKANRLIKAFIDRTRSPNVEQHTWTRAMSRPRRVLYLSSPIGLGHARRDVAIAKELATLRPDVQIDWLAQHPVTAVLEAEGQHVHPASEWLASESAHVASEAEGHDLHCFQALRSMDEILVANFMVFQEVVEEGQYDLVVCDEAWDVDHFWHENPELKRASLAWMTDFVGFLPMPHGGAREAYLTADYNAEMIEHIARFPRIRDRAIFVGDADDVVDDSFGADLPSIRDWTEQHFSFSGYVTGFEPPDPDRVAELRAGFGYRPDEKVCIAAVGGSGVGRALLELVIAAFPIAKAGVPELRLVVVAGPRIDPASLPSSDGLEVVGYVNRLHEHLSVCDLGIVQGGLTTTMELTAAKRPFLYFPLRHHFEQNFHVRHRLDRHRAGTRMDFHATGPDELADAILRELTRPVDYVDIASDGAAHAARLIAELV